MRYFVDTEFIEDGKTIDLISIGIVAEDSREYYAVNIDCEFQNASDWVWRNVLYPIGIHEPLEYVNLSDPSISAQTKETLKVAKTRQAIRAEVLAFLGDDNKVDLWGNYSAYDFVAFSQLMSVGSDRMSHNPMVDAYPKNLPYFCNDIQQLAMGLDNPNLPEQVEGVHNALADARWNKQAWEYLNAIAHPHGERVCVNIQVDATRLDHPQ